MRASCTILFLLAVTPPLVVAVRADERPGVEFFERKVRPLLHKHCIECHSTEKGAENGELILDSSAGIKAGGSRGPLFVPEQPEKSLLIRAVRYLDDNLQMPPEDRIADDEIEALATWIRLGGAVPEHGPEKPAAEPRRVDIDAGRKHWAFQPFAAQPPHPTERDDWSKRPLDVFVLQELTKRGLRPTASADRRTLLRRAKFDLLGLPPTPNEVAEFLGDKDPDAWERLIDRLLASPHYGERWGRHWLDLARYTDTTASWLKSTAQAWLYRDWVVQALNQDLPYDRFVRLQLAADHYSDTTPADLAALGFLGLSPTYWKELRLAPDVIKTVVAEEWDERIDAVSRTFLGLTVSCARCHDHKFDPIMMEDYYALAGVFASSELSDRFLLPQVEADIVQAAHDRVSQLHEELKKLKEAESEQAKQLRYEIERIRQNTPHFDAPQAHIVQDGSVYVLPEGDDATKLDYRAGEIRDLPVFRRGNPSNPGPVVQRRFLQVLCDSDPEPFQTGSGRRDLAEAILNDARELTARVIVNRVWQHHFGQGLVRTPSNFGMQGERPTHPALLDELAAQLIHHSWSLKWLHREIMLSATYRQSSATRSDGNNIDPENRLLWRMNRRRLEFEAWRDAMLDVAGRLDRRMGGPPQALDDANHVRRTLYSTIARRELHPLLRLYDFPEPTAHGPRRQPTTTAIQQLFVLNGEFMVHQAAALAGRIADEPTDEARVRRCYRLLFAREPTEVELRSAREFLSTAANVPLSADEAWSAYCQALLGLNEFLFID